MADKKSKLSNRTFIIVCIVMIAYCVVCGIILYNYTPDNSRNSDYTVVTKSRDELERKTDINSANADELSSLPGIGNVLSQRIIHYRNSNGPFESVDEIKSVDGIDEIIFEKIKDKICVSGSNAYKSGSAETEPISVSTTSTATDKLIETDISFPLDLNTCTLEELEQIPGLPENIARQIIDLRTKIKKFSRIEEILMVDSINRELYNIICKYVYIKE